MLDEGAGGFGVAAVKIGEKSLRLTAK